MSQRKIVMRTLFIFGFCFVLLSFSGKSQAQDFVPDKPAKIIRIVGKLTDKQTGAPVPFANVGVVGSYIGAASNMDGFFEVKVPASYRERYLQVSAVGFSTFKSTIAECMRQDSLNLELVPRNYKIPEVEVTAESLVLFKTIKNAINHITKNYLQTPFNYSVYYRSRKWENNTLNRLREAAVEIYDNAGYQRKDAYQVFKERGYRFLQVRKNFEIASLADGSTYLDDLLEMDVVRVRGNILNKNHLNFYDLKLEKITEYENDSIWVIAYKSKRPLLTNTGDYYAKSYRGKIYINMKDYAVVKNETYVTSANYSPQGRSFYVNEEKQEWKPEKIEYSYTTIYKKHSGFYYLSYVNYKRHHELTNKQNGAFKSLDISAELVITQIRTSDPVVISQRDYYENMPYDKEFWKSYNILPDSNE